MRCLCLDSTGGKASKAAIAGRPFSGWGFGAQETSLLVGRRGASTSPDGSTLMASCIIDRTGLVGPSFPLFSGRYFFWFRYSVAGADIRNGNSPIRIDADGFLRCLELGLRGRRTRTGPAAYQCHRPRVVTGWHGEPRRLVSIDLADSVSSSNNTEKPPHNDEPNRKKKECASLLWKFRQSRCRPIRSLPRSWYDRRSSTSKPEGPIYFVPGYFCLEISRGPVDRDTRTVFTVLDLFYRLGDHLSPHYQTFFSPSDREKKLGT